MAKRIVRDFKPEVVIGVGGYASGPTLWMASSLGVPVLIQEQNSFAGLTNKLLGKRATKICVAYKGMEKFFPKDRIVITGNPVRKELEIIREKDPAAYSYFGLSPDKPVLLVIGGSLGARTINNSLLKGIEFLINAGIQVIWQTGKTGYHAIKDNMSTENRQLKTENRQLKTENYLWFSDFITRMDYAYSIADLVVSRAGAGTISELSLLKKAAILIPSPNVAEDHQTKNARALSDCHAAVLIPDNDAEIRLVSTAIDLLSNTERLKEISENIALFAQPNSAEHIVDEALIIH